MATEFKLPELGENVTGGDITRIMVKVGDTIKVDQPVVEIETGKATIEVPSNQAGVIKAILIKEGSKATVGQPIFSIEVAAGSAPAPAAATPAPAPAAAQPAPAPAPVATPKAAPAPARAPAATPVSAPPPPSSEAGRAVPASPSTRQFAREIGVDIQQVQGSGPGDRVSVDDVKSHARAMAAGMIRSPGKPAQVPLPDFSKFGVVERQPLSAIRLATADHMAHCWSTIPHVTLCDKADITELEKLRQASKSKAEAAGGKLTLTAFLIKIVASALKVFPQFNASLDMTRQELVLKQYFNIGVAVDTGKGLVVPVLREADRKNVFQIAVELGRLADKAKAKKMTPEDMQGGCITITNIGGIAGSFFTPIVNHPEVAILGVGKAAMEPVLVNGFFQPRLMMPLSLSFDHRVIDGADGARFMRWILDAIQQPVLLSLEG